MTLLASTLMLQQPVAAQSTSGGHQTEEAIAPLSTNCVPFFAAPLVPVPNCSTTASFVLINTDRSLEIVIVGLKCGGQLVTNTVTLKALQVRLADGVIFEAGSIATTLILGNGVVTLPAGGGALLGNCGTGDTGSFGTTCQSLIIAVENQAGTVQYAATGIQ
jgi:hypothetical protein